MAVWLCGAGVTRGNPVVHASHAVRGRRCRARGHPRLPLHPIRTVAACCWDRMASRGRGRLKWPDPTVRVIGTRPRLPPGRGPGSVSSQIYPSHRCCGSGQPEILKLSPSDPIRSWSPSSRPCGPGLPLSALVSSANIRLYTIILIVGDTDISAQCVHKEECACRRAVTASLGACRPQCQVRPRSRVLSSPTSSWRCGKSARTTEAA